MIVLHLRFENYGELVSRLRRVDRLFRWKLTDAVNYALEHGRRRAAALVERQSSTKRHRTGQLARSITGEVSGPRENPVGTLTADRDYASFVEHGTKAHPIYPKAPHGTKPSARGQGVRAKTDIGTHRIKLRWYPNGLAGSPRFAYSVNHPGARRKPFMAPAQVSMGSALEAYVESVVVAEAQRLLEK